MNGPASRPPIVKCSLHELTADDLGRITLRSAEPVPLDAYAVSRRTGAFILIDPADGATLTAGMVDFA